jgi:hypothetical protein
MEGQCILNPNDPKIVKQPLNTDPPLGPQEPVVPEATGQLIFIGVLIVVLLVALFTMFGKKR